jgi:hypothetical protein
MPSRGTGDLASPTKLVGQFNTLYNTLVTDGGYGSGSAEGRPSAGRLQRKRDLDPQWAALRARLEQVLREDLARFNTEVSRRGAAGVVVPTRRP